MRKGESGCWNGCLLRVCAVKGLLFRLASSYLLVHGRRSRLQSPQNSVFRIDAGDQPANNILPIYSSITGEKISQHNKHNT